MLDCALIGASAVIRSNTVAIIQCTSINPLSRELGTIFFVQISEISYLIHIFNINMTELGFIKFVSDRQHLYTDKILKNEIHSYSTCPKIQTSLFDYLVMCLKRNG